MRSSRVIAGLLTALACHPSSVIGQTIIAPVISDSPLRASTLAGESSSPAPASDLGSTLTSPLPLLAFGPLAFRPHASYRYAHASGLLFKPGEPLATDTQTLGGGTALEVGDHWHADYTGSWVRYSNQQLKDGFNQAASLSASYDAAPWTIGGSAAYTSGRPMLVETAGQAKEQTFNAGVSAHRTIGLRSFVDLSASHSYRKADAVSDMPGATRQALRDWSGRAALGQTLTSRLSATFGVTAGYGTEELGADMSYTRPELTVSWTPTDKIAVGATAGWERRRFRDSTSGTLNSPVYAGSVTYRPVETTSVTAGASQGVAASYIGSAVTRSTGWNVGLRQRLLQVLYANLGYARQRSRYYETVAALPHERTDNYDSISGSLALAFLQHGSASLFYNRTHNGSSQLGYGFTSTEYGAEVSFAF